MDETLALLGGAWQQLPTAFDAAGAAAGMTADEAAESVGLLLEQLPERWSYDATPRNSVTFASTGGDGVHYSVVTDAGRPGPVVMTVPMNLDRPNLVVGADLRGFLALGCHFGYFALEQLTYNYGQTVRRIEAASTGPQNDDEAVVLAAIRERLGLQPPSNVRALLDGLQDRFGQHLEQE